jgi:hypothetical protein
MCAALWPHGSAMPAPGGCAGRLILGLLGYPPGLESCYAGKKKPIAILNLKLSLRWSEHFAAGGAMGEPETSTLQRNSVQTATMP